MAERTDALDEASRAGGVGHLITETERAVMSYRKTAFHRFPFLFASLTIFGSVATVFGVERMLEDVGLFYEHPSIPLVAGLLVLAATGRLYKHLS